MLILAVSLLAFPIQESDPRPFALPAKPEHATVSPEHLPGRLHLKTTAASGLRDLEQSSLIQERLALFGGQSGSLFPFPSEQLDDFVAQARARSGRALHDLSLFHRIDVAPQHTAELCDALNQLEGVELCWPAPSFSDPIACIGPVLGGSPDFEDLQGYRQAAPLGIDADYANSFPGGRGAGQNVFDVETGWTFDHEDFGGKLADGLVGAVPANYPWDHGTATMAEILAIDNGSGVKGIAFEADGFVTTHTPMGGGFNLAAAVATAVLAASPGDVVLLEVQCFGDAPGPFPCEFDPAIFAAVQAATASGIHVVAAAGNGAHDLDSPAYGGAFDLSVQDSGAILVGATNGADLSVAGFSNFGSRITSNGWGEDVASAGYGDLLGGPATAEYTNLFSGTSSASPIVTGALMLLNSIHQSAFGSALEPLAMRQLLLDTGTATTGAIGRRPDLARAIEALDIPRLCVAGDTGAGGQVTLEHGGLPQSAFALFLSTGLVDPLAIDPFGDLLIDPVSGVQLLTGSLDSTGLATSNLPIPPSPATPGLQLWFQALEIFQDGSGGSFTNFAGWQLP